MTLELIHQRESTEDHIVTRITAEDSIAGLFEVILYDRSISRIADYCTHGELTLVAQLVEGSPPHLAVFGPLGVNQEKIQEIVLACAEACSQWAEEEKPDLQVVK